MQGLWARVVNMGIRAVNVAIALSLECVVRGSLGCKENVPFDLWLRVLA